MKKVLVADDKATSRELIRTVLESSGYSVNEATDGIEAVQSARELHPDLIILDLHMPGLDGFGVLAELRHDRNFAATPIMALTASAMQGDRERAIVAGFDSYVSKPIPLPLLREEVQRLLARGREFKHAQAEPLTACTKVKNNGTCPRYRSFTVRLHGDFSLPVPATHDGPRFVDRDPQDDGSTNPQCALRSVRAFLGKDLRHQFRHGRCYRHTDGIPVRHQLGRVRKGGGRGDRTDARHGRHVQLLPRKHFLGLFLFGEKRLGPTLHWLSAVAVWLGSWLSGFFIIATDAWMQHPVGYALGPKGEIVLNSLLAYSPIPGSSGSTPTT